MGGNNASGALRTESFCITLNDGSIGATLRIDLPRQPGSSPTSQESTNPYDRSAQTQEARNVMHRVGTTIAPAHAYTRTSSEHAAPVLTAIGYINWWEGRGSKGHQFFELALDTVYRIARLSDQIIGSGIVAGCEHE